MFSGGANNVQWWGKTEKTQCLLRDIKVHEHTMSFNQKIYRIVKCAENICFGSLARLAIHARAILEHRRNDRGEVLRLSRCRM